MLWLALLVCAWPEADACAHAFADARAAETARALAAWALQFTPRVALLEQAVVLELASSLRLFGGFDALCRRLREQAIELGAQALAWAATSQAALALARGGVQPTPPRDLAQALDALPLHCLSAVAEQAHWLQRLGCRRLGDVRRLPRSGLARRGGQRLLQQIDQAYGLAAESYPWFALPETFQARLELAARVDDAQALLFGARRLLLQLEGWLGARQAGAVAWHLQWRFDTLRKGGGGLLVRSALPLRHADELARLLGEHLRQQRLAAPVCALRLRLLQAQPLPAANLDLLCTARHAGEQEASRSARALGLALQRVAARLGGQRVLQGTLRADHRPEFAQDWRAFGLPAAAGAALPPPPPRPSFLLPEPLALGERHGQPWWGEELQLLLGPLRIEGGWWQQEAGGSRHQARDYWVAWGAGRGLLWVFRTRDAARRDGCCTQWYVQGVFA